MLLVSLDFKSQIEKTLIPFINEKKLQAEVIVLSDPNSNVWNNKINKFWSGAIPATIIYNKDFHFFLEGSMTKKEFLADAVDALLANKKPKVDFTKAIGCSVKFAK